MSESADNSSSPSPEPAQPFYGPRNRGRREAGAGTPPNSVTLLLTQHHLLPYTEDKKVSNWLLTFFGIVIGLGNFRFITCFFNWVEGT